MNQNKRQNVDQSNDPKTTKVARKSTVVAIEPVEQASEDQLTEDVGETSVEPEVILIEQDPSNKWKLSKGEYFIKSIPAGATDTLSMTNKRCGIIHKRTVDKRGAIVMSSLPFLRVSPDNWAEIGLAAQRMQVFYTDEYNQDDYRSDRCVLKLD